MINRIGNCGSLSNDSFERIAEVINKKSNKKLYKICSTMEDASIAIKELKLQGFNSEVEKLGNNINVYSLLPESISLAEAEGNGGFKKLAWGRYCFQKCNAINDFQTFNFDDGSIWRTITKEDGKQYLVKEVEDNNEDVVIRKTAGLVKKAAYIVSEQNLDNSVKVVYNDNNIVDSQFFMDIKSSNLKQSLVEIIDLKIVKLVEEKFQQHGLSDNEVLSNLKDYVRDNITNNTIYDIDSFNSVITARMVEIVEAMEILKDE